MAVSGVYLHAPDALSQLKKNKIRYPFTVGWVGPRADLDHSEKEKSLYGDFDFYDDKAGKLRWAGPARHMKYIEFPWGYFEKQLLTIPERRRECNFNVDDTKISFWMTPAQNLNEWRTFVMAVTSPDFN